MTLKSGEVYFSEQNSSFILPETISLFGLSISFYGLFLVVAALIGIVVISEATRRKRQNIEWSLTLITLVIVAALLGGRVYYVLFEWQKFTEEPLSLLNLRSGGLSYFGALFGAWFAVKWYCRRKNADFLQSADLLCAGAAAAAPLVWCGCAFVREPLGRLYDGIFSIRISAEYWQHLPEGAVSDMANGSEEGYLSMHPVAIYGIALSIVAFVILGFVFWKAKQTGTLFTVYLTLNAVVMLVLECFRGDRYCIWGTEIPVNFVVSGVILLTLAIGWLRRVAVNKRGKRFVFMHDR